MVNLNLDVPKKLASLSFCKIYFLNVCPLDFVCVGGFLTD